MKKTLVVLSIVLSFGLMAFTFKPAADIYTVDTEKSSIEWLAKKVTGQHNGTIKISTGTLLYNGAALTGGKFDINMNTIADADGSEKLIGHLKSEDFFSVAKNPVSTFVITKVMAAGKDQVNITGNLTIKGITDVVTFPATVKKQGNLVVAVAKGIRINRIKYDIRYGSKSFFASIGDKAIDDEFELSVNLLARK